ncbi:MAG: lipoyl synthase [Phycisphaerales bacterium]|nr:lipoyl synthase [Phycisphaerales bacterium]
MLDSRTGSAATTPPADHASDDAIRRTLARHPRPLGGDPVKQLDAPKMSLSGLILNNAGGAIDTIAPKRKPSWLKAKVPGGPGYERLKGIMDEHGLHTVCQEAGCPNMGECWARGVATIMILGDTCTRACGFCNVKTGRPASVDKDEPRRVAESLRLMGLKHVVITSVNRDELPDGGAAIWAETIMRSKDACPTMSIEVLIPDFEGNWDALQMVIDAGPHIINHNLETVRRMYPAVRPSAKFDRSLELLRRVKEQGGVAKTGIMVGIGERDEEVLELMDDVIGKTTAVAKWQGAEVAKWQSDKVAKSDPAEARGESADPSSHSATLPVRHSATSPSSTDILTIGQYLQPTRNHLPLDRFVTPEQFAMYQDEGLKRGFKVVQSGPLVRSSYHADHQADELSSIKDEREKRNVEAMRGLLGG